MRMWATDSIIGTLKSIREKYNIKGSMDAEKFCKELGIDINELVYLFSYLFMEAFDEIGEAEEERRRLRSENERLNSILVDKCKGNKRAIQMAKVISGLPIAQKKKKNLTLLSIYIRMGLTDEEIMEKYEISKSTLWRWKKELEEKEKSSTSLYF